MVLADVHLAGPAGPSTSGSSPRRWIPLAEPAQIAAAFALLTWPGLSTRRSCGIASLGVPAPAAGARLALVLVVVLGWGLTDLCQVDRSPGRGPD